MLEKSDPQTGTTSVRHRTSRGQRVSASATLVPTMLLGAASSRRATRPTAFSPALAVALLVGVYAIPLLGALRLVIDWDLGWHLRTGQWVVEHGHVPANDPFSAYGADRPWVAYSWLFEVVMYGIYSCLGLPGVVLFRAAMALAVMGAFHRLVARREGRFLVSTLLIGVAALALIPLLNERPWLFTILFTTLTLDVVLDLRE